METDVKRLTRAGGRGRAGSVSVAPRSVSPSDQRCDAVAPAADSDDDNESVVARVRNNFRPVQLSISSCALLVQLRAVSADAFQFQHRMYFK